MAEFKAKPRLKRGSPKPVMYRTPAIPFSFLPEMVRFFTGGTLAEALIFIYES